MPYCQFCGTKLEEGQTCTCEMAKAAGAGSAGQQIPYEQALPQSQTGPAAPQAAPIPSVPKLQAPAVLKNLQSYLAMYIANPAQAVRSVMETESLAFPVVLSVIRLLAVGLAIYGLLRKVCANALSLVKTSLMGYGSASEILTAKISASLSKCLIYGALAGIIGMAVFIIITFAIVKIRHEETSLTDIFKASAANGVFTSALLLLSFLLSFVSVALAVAFAAFAMFSWMICGVLTIQLVCPNSSSGMFWLTYFVGVVVIFVVGYYTLPPLVLRSVGSITASLMGKTVTLQNLFDLASENINSAFAEVGASNLGEFFRKAWKELFDEFVPELWSYMYR